MHELRPRQARPSRLQRDLIEGEAAVEMVARGVASRVRVQGLRHGERVSPLLAATAQRAGVGFRIERRVDGGTPVLVFGPRLPTRVAG